MLFSRVLLYSSDSKRLSAFLGEIFDTEIDVVNESIFHSSDLINFEIKAISEQKVNLTNSQGQSLVFTVEDTGTLLEIKQKIEFFCYRQKIDTTELILEHVRDDLLVRDPDGRNWHFSVKNE